MSDCSEINYGTHYMLSYELIDRYGMYEKPMVKQNSIS